MVYIFCLSESRKQGLKDSDNNRFQSYNYNEDDPFGVHEGGDHSTDEASRGANCRLMMKGTWNPMTVTMLKHLSMFMISMRMTTHPMLP